MPAVRTGLYLAVHIGNLVLATVVLGEDFRVENRVFLENNAQPAATSTTLFHGGQAYDLPGDPAEITVFDVAHQRIILLDPRHKLRADLPFDDLENFNHTLELRILADGNKRLLPLVDPQFEEQFDRSTGELTLHNKTMTYHLATIPPESDSVVRRYVAFADWSARLQQLTNLHAPPFPRLAVNQALAIHKRLPREVRLTTTTGAGPLPQRQTIRAVHTFDRLTAEDRRRIDQIGELMARCDKVSVSDYLQRGEE